MDLLGHYTGAVKVIDSRLLKSHASYDLYAVLIKIKVLLDDGKTRVIDLKLFVTYEDGRFAILDVLVDNAIQVSKVLQKKFDKAVSQVGIDEVIDTLYNLGSVHSEDLEEDVL